MEKGIPKYPKLKAEIDSVVLEDPEEKQNYLDENVVAKELLSLNTGKVMDSDDDREHFDYRKIVKKEIKKSKKHTKQ